MNSSLKNSAVSALLLWLGIVTSVVYSGSLRASNLNAANSVNRAQTIAASATSGTTREIAIVNGAPVAAHQFPELTALLDASGAYVFVNGYQAYGRFFGHNVIQPFAGNVADCGKAQSICVETTGKVCLISTMARTDEGYHSPSEQLAHCAGGGGIAAIFIAGSGALPRVDMFDGTPSLPAVYFTDLVSQNLLKDAWSAGPVTVSVESRPSQTILCGATYLGHKWLLTAAHCVTEHTPDGLRVMLPAEIQASVGAYDLLKDQHLIQAVQEVVVSDYRRMSIGSSNDIALLKLKEEPASAFWLQSSDASLATFSIFSDQVRGKELSTALVLGWGSTQQREPFQEGTSFSSTSRTPNIASVSMLPLEQCVVRWNQFLAENNMATDATTIDATKICASDTQQLSDTCQGDSGGPLLIDMNGRYELAGITSYGLGCGGSESLPAVYTRVSAYKDWIFETTGLSEGDTHTDIALPVVTVSAFAAQPASGGGGVGWALLLCLSVFVVVRTTKAQCNALNYVE